MELSMAGLAFVALGFAALTVARSKSPIVARVCFIISAIIFEMALAAWGRSVEMTAVWRVALTAIASAFIGVLLVECYRWASPDAARVNGTAAKQIELAQEQLLELRRQGEETRKRQDRLEAREKAAAEERALAEQRREREHAANIRQSESVEAERAEEQRKAGIVDSARNVVNGFRNQYVLSKGDGISVGMMAGTEPVPDDWANARLKALGVRFTYRGHPSGGYMLEPHQNAFEKR